MTIISNSMYRKANQIVNAGLIMQITPRTWFIARPTNDGDAIVTMVKTKSGPRFRSTGKHFTSTRRQDTYITAVKIALGIENYEVDPSSVPTWAANGVTA